METQGSFMDIGAGQSDPARRPRKDRKSRVPCKTCGQPVKDGHSIYCCYKCQHDFTYRQYIERWLAGEVSGAKEGGVSHHVKRWLKETHGEKCQECGWSRVHPKTGRAPLHVHHIDGKYSNNTPSNLRLLCPNCHSLTENYGSLNNGNGRPYHVIKSSRLDA